MGLKHSVIYVDTTRAAQGGHSKIRVVEVMRIWTISHGLTFKEDHPFAKPFLYVLLKTQPASETDRWKLSNNVT